MDELKERLGAYPGLVGRDIVSAVTSAEPFTWRNGAILPIGEAGPKNGSLRVVVQDCGVKYNILRSLEELGCEVFVVFMGDSVAHEWDADKHRAHQNIWQAETEEGRRGVDRHIAQRKTGWSRLKNACVGRYT